jgi:hypothetical protein
MAWVILDMTPVLFQAIMLAEHWNQEVNSLIMTKKSFFVLQREKRKENRSILNAFVSVTCPKRGNAQASGSYRC